ncbi:MAG: 3-hydroxyanthranilate 3,4-dioxygenase [Bacteroidetes bacterium]|nr:3-hydroxyanthranilate 3,4-dioxygenase [Bacteroidota bacterium]
MAVMLPFNFRTWIDEHRHLLKPPVGNAQVYKDTEFIVMVVGGPNSRKDYHFNEGEEFFYQLEGDIVVKIIDDGVQKDIHIREGDIFLLPPKVPHSPQRGANTVGLVIERRRETTELDAFMWFCENCNAKLYEEFVELTDIVAQLPPIFKRYYGSDEHRRCKSCGTVMQPPPPVKTE